MRRLSLALVAISILVAGCAKPAPEVEAATQESLPEGVEVVSRAAAAGVNASANVTASGPSAPATSPPPVPVRIPFAAPVDLPLVGDIGGGEPNIAVLGDGTIFVTSPAGGTGTPNAAEGAAYLWRSKDNGSTWETLRAPVDMPFNAFCSCDADVVTSPDGWVYYSDWWIAGFGGNYLVEASSDGGDTWTAASVTTIEALGSVDRQWLVPGGDGFLGLFYSYFGTVVDLGVHPLVTSGIHAVFSTDHGATWGDPVVVLAPESGHSWQIAHPRMMPDGTLVMPYGDVGQGDDFWRAPSSVKLARSTDGGATWEHLVVADVPEGFDNLWAVQGDVDPSGAIHVAWAARVDDDIMATYVATSRDAGQTWTSPLALRSEGLNFLPWATTSQDGRIAIAWYGGDATGDVLEAEGDWFAWVAQSRDGGESFVVHKVTDTPVKTGNLCPKGAACNGDRELLDYPSLAYDATGALHYAFARSSDGIALTMVASALAEAVA